MIYVTFLPCLTYDDICCCVPEHSSCYISIIVYEACLCWEFGDYFSSAMQSNLLYRRVLNSGFWKYFAMPKRALVVDHQIFSSSVVLLFLQRTCIVYMNCVFQCSPQIRTTQIRIWGLLGPQSAYYWLFIAKCLFWCKCLEIFCVALSTVLHKITVNSLFT